jgi:hypothetical protein
VAAHLDGPRVDLRFLRVGLEGTRVGLWFLRVDLEGMRVGLEEMRVGLWFLRVGLKGMRVGLWFLRVGLKGMRVGLWFLRVGLKGMRVGLWFLRGLPPPGRTAGSAAILPILRPAQNPGRCPGLKEGGPLGLKRELPSRRRGGRAQRRRSNLVAAIPPSL